jgi:hypothetical protein
MALERPRVADQRKGQAKKNYSDGFHGDAADTDRHIPLCQSR